MRRRGAHTGLFCPLSTLLFSFHWCCHESVKFLVSKCFWMLKPPTCHLTTPLVIRCSDCFQLPAVTDDCGEHPCACPVCTHLRKHLGGTPRRGSAGSGSEGSASYPPRLSRLLSCAVALVDILTSGKSSTVPTSLLTFAITQLFFLPV